MITIKDSRLLLKMLELSIKGLIENEICTYCANTDRDIEKCGSYDLCADSIFDGLKNAAKRQK